MTSESRSDVDGGESQPSHRLEGTVRRQEPEGEGVERLHDPSLYINRELSLLEFNRRVLAQAQDSSVPLLERLRFLTICTSNLDEFFEVRVAGLREQIALEVVMESADGARPKELIGRISSIVHDLVAQQYELLSGTLIPALADEGIDLHFRSQWTEEIRGWCAGYFEAEVEPVLTPVGLDPAHPFPSVLNKSLNFYVDLEGRDAFGRESGGAVLQAPRLLPRVIKLPDSISGGRQGFVTLSSIISDNVEQLFPGMQVTGCWAFRVTRNSDLWVNEEEVDDLLRALQGELPRRHYGDSVRLEVEAGCPQDICRQLLDEVHLEEEDLYRVEGPVNLHRLSQLISLCDRPDLLYPPFTQQRPEGVEHGATLYRIVRKRDVLFHHPFEGFAPIEQMIEAAADDPKVLAIKITLYRTGKDAPLTKALAKAATNGKEVTAIVELRARFDEAANIHTATMLQKAGARVAYGVVGFKAHTKMILIVRRESRGIRRYVHMGTGNYHIGNTGSYTDFGLLTCDAAIATDVHDLFQQLTGLGKASHMKRLLQSPFTLHRRMIELIDDERQAALAGKPARIRAKMNSLVEPRVVRALYLASQAGVKVELIIRGVCALRPGLEGISENIRVISVVGRFLEHHRIYNFHAGGEEITYCSSADWMPRNFFRRIETAFPISDPALRARVIDEGLEVYLRDESQAWTLQADGSYAAPTDPAGFSAQRDLLMRTADFED